MVDFLDFLLKTGLPLIKNVIKPLAKSVLILLGLTVEASIADAGIHEKNLKKKKKERTIRNNNTNNIK